MQVLKKVTTQTVWQLLGKGGSSLSTIIILSIVSRNYGAQGTGVYTLALTYLSFFYLASDFGINAFAITRFNDSSVGNEWRKLLGLRLTFGAFLVLMAVIGAFIWSGFSGYFQQAVLFGVGAVIAYAINISANAYFQSRHRYDLAVYSTLIGTIFYFGVTFILAKRSIELPALVLGNFLGWALTAIFALIFIKRFLPKITPIFDFSYYKFVLKSVWPVSLTLVLNVLYFRVDAFILAKFTNFSDVGVYNLAYSIFQNILVLPTFIMNGYYPIMIKQFQSSHILFKNSLIKAGFLLLGLSLAAVVVSLVLSPTIISIISGGRGFEGSMVSLRILSLGFPAYFISALLMWSLITMKKYKIMAVVYILGLITNFILNLIFIPQYSYIASSWITGISEYLILILQIGILYKVLK